MQPKLLLTLPNILSTFQIGKYIPKDEHTKITDLIKNLNDQKYKKLKEQLSIIIDKSKFTKATKTAIDNLLLELKDDNITIERANDLIEETIKEIEDEQLEKTLDMSVKRYNKYSETNPAPNIRYDSSKKRYILETDDKKIKSKDLNKLVIKQKEILGDKKENLFPENVPQKKIEYKGKKIIIYIGEDKKAYFDINHTINLFDEIKWKEDKYKQNKNEIIGYAFRDNEHGGFYIKEFITKETFFSILLHTNSIFTNKFKDDVAKLLDILTNKNMLVIKNDNLELTSSVSNNLLLNNNYEYTQTYDNIELLDYIKTRIVDFKKVNWNKYLKRHIMYFFVITLEDPKKLNRILCKIGYSCDLTDRFKTLGDEYKCKFYLIGLKYVHNQKDEKEFHKILKKKYPELFVDLKIGQHNKDETYVFDMELYKTFLNYVDKDGPSDGDIKIEDETKIIIDNYIDNIENRFEMELLLKVKSTTNFSGVSNEFQMKLIINRDNMYYNYITEKAKAIELTKQEVEKTKQIEITETEKTKQVGFIEQTKQEKFKMIMLFVQKDNNFDFNKYISIL
jgi:hypothetical protein